MQAATSKIQEQGNTTIPQSGRDYLVVGYDNSINVGNAVGDDNSINVGNVVGDDNSINVALGHSE